MGLEENPTFPSPFTKLQIYVALVCIMFGNTFIISRKRLESREDLQTWKGRLIGKRIVVSNRQVAEWDGWKDTNMNTWEPRIYYCETGQKSSRTSFTWDAQPSSFLLSLPAEIRIHILQYVVPPHMISQQTEDTPHKGDAVWMNTSGVMFACKQLYTESCGLAIEQNTFDWGKLPKKTRLCAADAKNSYYDWER